MLTNLLRKIIFYLIFCSISYGQKTNDLLYKNTEKLTELNQTEEALKTSLQQIELAPRNSTQRAKWLQLTGIIFKKNDEINTSLDYFKKAYHINQQNKDSLALMLNHIYIGQIYHLKFNDLYEERFSKTAIKLKDSASFYYLKNINEFKNIDGGLDHIGSSHVNLSYLHSDLDNLDLAKEHINKAIYIYRNNDGLDKNALNTSLLNLGLIYIYQKNYKLAEKTNLDLLKRIKDTSELKPLITYHQSTENLAYIYKVTKNYEKALEYYNKEDKIFEVISKRQKAIEIRAIEAKYNVDKARQEEQLKTLEVEKKQERTQSVAIIGGLIALSIILFGSVLYRNSKLKQKNLSLSLVQQELNKQQEIRLLQQQTQSKVLNATLDGREKERKDIAQTLHDSVSALLSSANMHLQVIKKKTKGEIDEVSKSQRIIDEASDKVRDLSHKLISAVLLKFGIEHAVYEMCEKYSNQELNFELESEDPIPRFPEEFEVKINNILEEFINNILKHSKASEGVIRLNYNNNTLQLLIKDNGIGFDTSKINPKAGIGLSQIKARIENMNGQIIIESKPNQGTTIDIKVPTPKTIDK